MRVLHDIEQIRVSLLLVVAIVLWGIGAGMVVTGSLTMHMVCYSTGFLFVAGAATATLCLAIQASNKAEVRRAFELGRESAGGGNEGIRSVR